MATSAEVLEWVAKAEGDVEGARMLWQRFKPLIASRIVFHCHQAAEKYLKALLVARQVPFPRTHDLSQLAVLGRAACPDVLTLSSSLAFLQPFAVNARYPGYDPDETTCAQAVQHMDTVRAYCRRALGLASPQDTAADAP